MKKFLYLILAVIFFTGCEQDNNESPQLGTVKFSLTNGTQNGRTQNIEPAAILITIEDNNGNVIEGMENKKLSLISFGNGYVTESLALPSGLYNVTQFIVLDENDHAAYATPLEGSELEGWVSDPLPVSFSVSKDESTNLSIQVINIDETQSPEDFGYVTFNFDIIDTSPDDISISFFLTPNPYHETTGYDSVRLTFVSGNKVISKSLTMVSAVQGIGGISSEELASSTNWDLTVSAYYESIDEVLYNLHINESLTTASLNLSAGTSSIAIDENYITVLNSNDETNVNLNWTNLAHLSDNAGTFHFVLNNDFCDNAFEYDLYNESTYYVYYDKVMYRSVDGGESYDQVANRWAENLYPTLGHYSDYTTFQDICPEDMSGTLLQEVYFWVETYEATHICYLTWVEVDTPVDPEGRILKTKVLKVLPANENDMVANSSTRLKNRRAH